MRLPSFFWSTQFNYQIDTAFTTQLNYGQYDLWFHRQFLRQLNLKSFAQVELRHCRRSM